MGKTLYVGNLPVQIDERGLRALFDPFGSITTVDFSVDPETRRPRGVALVEMADADATRAAKALHGVDVDGHVLEVSERHERMDGSGGRGFGR